MKAKQISLIAFGIFFIFHAYGQSIKDNPEFQKFYLSLNAGLDFTLGASNTVLESFTLPNTKRMFVPEFDGAWFFTKNYGIGIKYRFSKRNSKDESYFPYTEKTYDYPVNEHAKNSFTETIHFIGPSFFAKWALGKSRWIVLTNAGVGYLHDKLSNIKHRIDYVIQSPDWILIDLNKFPQGVNSEYTDRTGTSIGFSLSAGIHYRISSHIGVGIDANGLFASISRMKYDNTLNGQSKTANIQRKINRVGLSSGVDFSF